MREDFLWVEKYRPRKIDDIVLPDDLKTSFKQHLGKGNLPNFIFAGTAGGGKTTAARALCEELGCDYIIINGSMHGNIDTLRNEIQNFASSVSLAGGRKYVILDEADYLNKQSTQPALRNFMEEFSANCGFILTCNILENILVPLRSRCSVVEFKISSDQKAKLAAEFFKRVQWILNEEGIEYDKKAVAATITKYFPDNRRVLNELQNYSASGKIDEGILVKMSDVSFKELMTALRNKQFSVVRKWVAKNSDGDSAMLFRKVYDTMDEYIEDKSKPQTIVTLADYMHKAAFACDPEINIMAMFTELMIECEWKNNDPF